jgi:hypothetical protein
MHLPAASQDDEQCTVVPNSQFVISRTAHRSNASNYYIDDRKSNFTEVTELLKGKGVDLDNNRFLILQVEQLCLSMAIYGFRAFAAWQMYYQRIRFASNDSIL